MKRFLVATMALAMLAGSATTALATHPDEVAATGKPAETCASWAHGLNLQQSATALSETSIQVTWKDWCSNEDRYHVLRSTTSGGTFTSVATVSAVAGATGIQLSSVDSAAACTTYYYQVRAVKDANRQGNGGGVSDSAVFSAATTGCDEGRPAQAIANSHLRPRSVAALRCETALGDNWHGMILSAAHLEFGTRKFAPSEEHEVTGWIDTVMCA